MSVLYTKVFEEEFDEQLMKFLEVCKKIHINIPFADA